jgi:hypothetical protein
MKKPIRHVPIIGFNRASCSCGRWHGAQREYGESVGAFTYRAHESHTRHGSEVPEQTTLDMGEQVEMFA